VNKDLTQTAFRFDTRLPYVIIKVGGFKQKYPDIKSVIIENQDEYGTGNVVAMTTDPNAILDKITRDEGYQWLRNSFCYRIDLTKLGEVIEIANNKEVYSSELITLNVQKDAITQYKEVKNGKLVGGWKPMPIDAWY
jgi:hypothetical protein